MPLPTFIIGGARRGGTTSLYHAIQSHPAIYLYPHSELNYFVEEEVNGRKYRNDPVNPDRWEKTHSIEDYGKQFDGGSQARAIGHKGADLLFWQPAHSRIARFVPDARFIFSLRHPLNRAWSHYWVEHAKGRESLSFEEALAREEERIQNNDWQHFHLSYRTRGFYDISLEHFLKIFPRDNVLIITLEETIAQPRQVLQRVYRFLDVNPELGLESAGGRKKQNWATVPRQWTQLAGLQQLVTGFEFATDQAAKFFTKSKESRRRLRNIFQKPVRKSTQQVSKPIELFDELNSLYAPHIRKLEDLAKRSFEEWRR
jgi:hypothetical protein